MAKPEKYPKRLQAQALRLAREDKTSRQIARSIGVPKRIVKEWIKPEREARARDRAKRLERRGHDPSAIAARLDATVTQVRRWLAAPNRRPSEPHTSGRRHGSDTRRCARKMAELRDPILHIADVLEVTPKTVRTWLRVEETEDGVSLLPGGRHRVHDRNAILEDVRARDSKGNPLYTRAQIREKHKCSRSFLSHLINGKLD
jgi:hypothetical protein